MSLLTETFDFFLPRFCPSCNSKLNSNEKTVCRNCIDKIKFASAERVKYEFEKKYLGKGYISGFESLYVFEKDKELQNIIHKLKYSQRFQIGNFLGREIGSIKRDEIASWQIDLIIPVPLHKIKEIERGYNQSNYIAKGIGRQISAPVDTHVVKRKRFTLTQTTMNMDEREKNVSGAFKLRNRKRIINKNIMLVDDVITTGATTNECAKVLIDGGAVHVYAVSAAIAE